MGVKHLFLAWLRLYVSREKGFGLVLELFGDKQEEELKTWTRGTRRTSLDEYKCVGEENENGESEGVVALKYEGEKEEKVGMFVKLELESY